MAHRHETEGFIEDRIEKLEALCEDLASHTGRHAMATRLDALEKRCTDLGHKADGAHTRVGAQQGQVDALRKHLNQLITILGYEIGDYGRVHLKRQEASINEHDQALLRAQCDQRQAHPNPPALAACGNPECGQCYDQRPAKRTIKGGWYCVFLAGGVEMGYTSTGPWPSREVAKFRHHDRKPFAVIHMPDFAEGEGL